MNNWIKISFVFLILEASIYAANVLILHTLIKISLFCKLLIIMAHKVSNWSTTWAVRKLSKNLRLKVCSQKDKEILVSDF